MALDRVVKVNRRERDPNSPPFDPDFIEVTILDGWGEYREQTIRARADAQIADGNEVIRIRYNDRLQVGDTMIVDGAEKNVRAIHEIGRRRWLDVEIAS